jgi:hypothetical protein
VSQSGGHAQWRASRDAAQTIVEVYVSDTAAGTHSGTIWSTTTEITDNVDMTGYVFSTDRAEATHMVGVPSPAVEPYIVATYVAGSGKAARIGADRYAIITAPTITLDTGYLISDGAGGYALDTTGPATGVLVTDGAGGLAIAASGTVAGTLYRNGTDYYTRLT